MEDVIIVGGEPTPEEIAAAEVIQKRKVDAMTKLRSERDALIPSTDKYVTWDYPIRDELRKKWGRYRQHLRDLPGMSSPDLDEDGKLTGVEWPTFEGIEVKVTPPSAQEKDLETTRIDLVATLEATKTDLKADLSETKADLQTTQTELTEERALHETTRTQLQDVLRKFEKLEMRTAYLESALIS